MSNAPRILTTNYSSVQRFLLLQSNDFLPKSNWSFDLYRTYLGFPEHSKLQVHHFRHWVGMNLSLYQIKRTAIKIPESSSPIQDGANKPGAGRRPIIYIWKEFEISEVTAPSQYTLNYVGPQCSDPSRYGCQCYIDRIDIDDLKKQLFYFRIHLYMFSRTDAYLGKVDNYLTCPW